MMKKRRVRKENTGNIVFNVATMVLTFLAHVAIIVLFVLSNRYYEIELKTFLGIIGVLVCLLIITDILFFVGFNYNELPIKIVNCVLAIMLLTVGTVGSVYVGKINDTVNNVIENDGTDQYETIGGTFAYYSKNTGNKVFNSLDDLKSASSLKVGILYDDGVGTGTLATKILSENNINATTVQYNTIDDLLSALVGTDEDNVDVAVFPSSYRQRLSNDDNVDYSQYLENIVDFYLFEEKTKTGENENANKDLSSEPFNILLIGFAPEDEAMTYGLADSIIVATVNPQTLTVVMTSIARDSFVPISCYSGTRDKINAARGTSRQCLMDTVGDLLDLNIDYYMEVNFLGVVQIVDAIGGIIINNPVTFVGQTPSGTRGEFTVLVPAGENVPADGAMALAFARERHAMPNGDFDRQQHQQEVITAIAKGLIELRDVNKALDVMEAAGNNISTNLSLKQLTGVFNYIINAKNNMGIPTFGMIDIQNMRITGYASWTYNYSMRLPLWIYKLYNGSIKEAKDRIYDVMNEYDKVEIHQPYLFKFFASYPYNRGLLYSEYFNEAEEHEELPSYYPSLTKYTYQEAMSWAASNGVSLAVTFIPEDSPNFVASQAGYVVDQYPRQGALVTEWPSGSITVMGTGDPNYVPTYTVKGCDNQSSCEIFATSNGINVAYEYQYFKDNSHTDGEFAGTNYKNGDAIKKDQTLVIYLWKKVSQINIPSGIGSNANDYASQLKNLGLNVTMNGISDGANETNNGQVISISCSSGSDTVAYPGDTVTINYYSYAKPTLNCGEHGSPNAEGTACVCSDDYTGASCEIAPTPPTPPTPSINCGEHGSPNAEGTACVCSEGYTGDACDVAPEPVTPDPPQEG